MCGWSIRLMSSTPPGTSVRRFAREPPPGPERLEEFFDFLKARIATARKYVPAARDYALFRTLYLAGIRAEEASSLDAVMCISVGALRQAPCPVRQGSETSGPRPRWVPMLDGLDLMLRWFLDDVRPRFGVGPVLFCDESGGRIHRGTIRNRLGHLMELEAPTGSESPTRSASSARTRCGGPAPPTTTSVAWIWLPFNSFWDIGR